MIGPNAHEIAESLRRAPRRGDCLLAIDALKIATASQLADVVGITVGRVGWIMHGRLPYYRIDRALVRLGLVIEIRTARGRAFEITPFGARVAPLLTDERHVRHRALHARLTHVKRRRLRA